MPVPEKRTITLPNGESLDLFYIGVLAEALGRTPQSIRKWEISGVIPETCFRDVNRARLYSREQIDAIVRCAERAKISRGKPVSHTTFSMHVYRAFTELQKKYLGG